MSVKNTWNTYTVFRIFCPHPVPKELMRRFSISIQGPQLCGKASLIPIVLVTCPSSTMVLKGRGFCSSSIVQITRSVPRLLADIVALNVHSLANSLPSE